MLDIVNVWNNDEDSKSSIFGLVQNFSKTNMYDFVDIKDFLDIILFKKNWKGDLLNQTC